MQHNGTTDIDVKENREQNVEVSVKPGSNANVGSGPAFWDVDQTGG